MTRTREGTVPKARGLVSYRRYSCNRELMLTLGEQKNKSHLAAHNLLISLIFSTARLVGLT
jgi:hypothetical protein